MLGDEQLLDQPQVGLDLLPQALRHEADPQVRAEHPGGPALPLHQADAAPVQHQALEQTLHRLPHSVDLLHLGHNFLQGSQVLLVGQ